MEPQTNFAWNPPNWFFQETGNQSIAFMIVAGVLACVVACLVLVHLFGKSPYAQRHPGLLLIRLTAIALVAIVLFGPTLVRRQLGKERRSELFYLVDGSRSMEVGDDQTRWAQAVSFLDQAIDQAGEEASLNTQAFQFGHRISPLKSETEGEPVAKSTDTRLADALRQAAARFGAAKPAGVVVFSDGRVRSAEAVEQMARRLGETGVPIHVAPVGVEGTGGDVAVISAVVPTRVRKFSDCEVQVFIRSFGMSGKRTQVRVVNSDSLVADESVSTIASVPLTLVGGAQAVSLPVHMDDRAKNVKVVIDPIEGELSTGNNVASARIAIDNTKIRVLYLEGDPTIRTINRLQQSFLFSGNAQPAVAPVKQALSEDEDIECVVLMPDGSGGLSGSSGSTSQITKFPQSRSTLFAFDCVILSNLTPDLLTPTQSQQLVDWVGGRGGGLVVVGPESLDVDAWGRSALSPALPVVLPDRLGRSIDEKLTLTEADHAIWQLSRDEPTNNRLLQQLPDMREIATGLQTKPLAKTIATVSPKSPVMVAGRYGRGRVVVSSVALAGGDATKLFNSWGDSPGQAASKLWRNLVYWATEASSVGRRRLIAAADKRFYRPGDMIRLSGRAYDETARTTNDYRIWCMLEPLDLNDMSLYGPVLWPDGQARTSGETGPRVAWGEEFVLKRSTDTGEYELPLILSENDSGSDGGFRVELTAFEGDEPDNDFSHGTQVDSTSLEIRVLSDPFEMRNPLPNHDLLRRVASVSGGTVLETPGDLAKILGGREVTREQPQESRQPAWDRWWWLAALVGLLSVDWIWRRFLGMA